MALQKYTRGYATTATETWVSPLLQGSNSVVGSVSWVSSSDLLIAIATVADVVIINKDANIQVGYASLAGGFTSIVKQGDYLYLGTALSGIFKLDLSSLDISLENGDITPSPWNVEYSTTTSPAISTNVVQDLLSCVTVGDDFLVALITKALSGQTRNLIDIINVTDGTVAASSGWAHTSKIAICGSSLYAVCGNVVNVLYDITTAAAGWFFDVTGLGNGSDDFLDNSIQGWSTDLNPAVDGSASITEASNKLSFSIRSGSAAISDAIARRTVVMCGDFDIRVSFTVDWSNIGNDETEKCYLRALAYNPTTKSFEWASSLYIERWRYKVGSTLYDQLRWLKTGAAYSSTSYSQTTFALRINRSGSTWSLYYGSDPDSAVAQLGTDYTSMPTGPVLFQTYAYQWGGDANFLVDVTGVETRGFSASTIYTTLPSKAITGVSVAQDSSTAGTNQIFAVCDGTLYSTDTNETVIGSSEKDGLVYTVDDTDTYELVTSYPGSAWKGSSGIGQLLASTSTSLKLFGLDAVSQPNVIETFDTSSVQPLIDGDIVELSFDEVTYVGDYQGFVYGTDDGAGWIYFNSAADAFLLGTKLFNPRFNEPFGQRSN